MQLSAIFSPFHLPDLHPKIYSSMPWIMWAGYAIHATRERIHPREQYPFVLRFFSEFLKKCVNILYPDENCDTQNLIPLNTGKGFAIFKCSYCCHHDLSWLNSMKKHCQHVSDDIIWYNRNSSFETISFQIGNASHPQNRCLSCLSTILAQWRGDELALKLICFTISGWSFLVQFQNGWLKKLRFWS